MLPKLFDVTLIILLVCLFSVQGEDILNKTEGSVCEVNGINGTCVPAYRCLSLIKRTSFDRYLVLDRHYDYPPIICSYQGKVPIICCTDCKLVDNVSLAILDPNGKILFKDGRNKGWDSCLDYVDNLNYKCLGYFLNLHFYLNKENKCHDIYPSFSSPSGGKPAKRGEYPHMALLGYGEALDSAQWLCGGSVISERFVLTAAHCISSVQFGPVTYIALGILKRTDPPELWNIYQVKRIIPHPEYTSPSKYHDIALLETHKLIKFHQNLLPACLPYNVANDTAGKATGWGALGHRRGLADTLETVTIEKYSDEECSALYPEHRHLKGGFNSTTQICYGDHDGIQDTCQGDSGGPLQVKTQEPTCIYTIIGVTSSGKECEFTGNAGLYTRVSHYVPWIESVVWP